MTHEALRFLALNAVLHGHAAVEGFDGNISTMAQALEISEAEATALNNSLEDLPAVDTSDDELTKVFLNFYRNSAYAFVDMGSTAFPLRDLVDMDLNGQVTDQLRFTFLTGMLYDVTQDEKYVKPYILDGVLYCTPEEFKKTEKAMKDAYQLYLGGPTGTPKGLSTALRKHTSMEYYARVSAHTLLKIFRQMVRCKRSPVIYQQTMLNTPDLLDVYGNTGCIMAFRDGSHTTIDWILDTADVAGSTMVVSVDTATLKPYLVRDVKDLAGAKAMHGVGESEKILFPGVK